MHRPAPSAGGEQTGEATAPDRELTLAELGNPQYLVGEDRYVVSLIVGYSDSDAASPEHAFATALDLTRDLGSDDTTWIVFDRRTGELRRFEQGDIADTPHIDDEWWRAGIADAG
jgi:hypothetical protein